MYQALFLLKLEHRLLDYYSALIRLFLKISSPYPFIWVYFFYTHIFLLLQVIRKDIKTIKLYIHPMYFAYFALVAIEKVWGQRSLMIFWRIAERNALILTQKLLRRSKERNYPKGRETLTEAWTATTLHLSDASKTMQKLNQDLQQQERSSSPPFGE